MTVYLVTLTYAKRRTVRVQAGSKRQAERMAEAGEGQVVNVEHEWRLLHAYGEAQPLPLLRDPNGEAA